MILFSDNLLLFIPKKVPSLLLLLIHTIHLAEFIFINDQL